MAATASTASVLYERIGAVGFLTLNRPERRNALSAEIRTGLHTALDWFEADAGARVAILRGAGPSFCSGFDLSGGSASVAETAGDPWRDRERLHGWIDLTLRIWESPRPIIAQVQGHCLAGGILLLLASDLVVVADNCAVGWPRLPVGAGFMDGAVAQLVGQRRAKQISFVVGSRITGAEAAEWGLANIAVPDNELEAKTLALASRIAKAPGSVLEIRKAAINRAVGANFREALLAGVEWDALAHVDPAVRKMRALVREHGMKKMIERFEDAEDPVAELGLDGREPSDQL